MPLVLQNNLQIFTLFESPGGWNILGSTPTKIFDQKNEKQPTLICPGDKVLFYEIQKRILQN